MYLLIHLVGSALILLSMPSLHWIWKQKINPYGRRLNWFNHSTWNGGVDHYDNDILSQPAFLITALFTWPALLLGFSVLWPAWNVASFPARLYIKLLQNHINEKAIRAAAEAEVEKLLTR